MISFLNEFLSGNLAQSFKVLSRNALVITETEDRLIAAAAIIGDNSVPVSGYSTPAATGTPSTL